jgi:hypothetical protein
VIRGTLDGWIKKKSISSFWIISIAAFSSYQFVVMHKETYCFANQNVAIQSCT